MQPKPYLTPEEYLSLERAASHKSEFYAGEVFAMIGASRRHNLIVANLVGELRRLLRDRPCEIYANDMRVQVSATSLSTYPDVVIVCGEPAFEDHELDTLLNPTLLVEVLSESTKDYDRGAKFEQYRQLASLQEYVLVAQDRVHVEHFTRQPDGRWLLAETDHPEDTLSLPSLDYTLAVAEVYLKVQGLDEGGG